MSQKIKIRSQYQTVITLFISVIVICSASGYAYADSLNISNDIRSSKTEVTKSSVSFKETDNVDVVSMKVKCVVFVGLADNHTMEITVEGETVAVQFDEKLKLEIEELQEGDHIKVRYTEQVVRGDTAIIRNLTSIRK
ncbi:MAG TPA: hypothetical protein VGI33_07040 [Paenibacillus sp.]|jgi:uncharacterized protein YpmB